MVKANAGKPTHGRASTYRKHGCRCVKCKRAHADAMKEYRDQKGKSA
jgi:hypothetical protein